MTEFDFNNQNVVVVGGSTGIGNAMAQAFRAHGASVHVTGTRSSPSEYSDADVADLTGLSYSQLDCSDPNAVRNWSLALPTLKVLICCQGATKEGRAEFEHDTFREIVEINLNASIDCCEKFRAALVAAKGNVILVSSVAAFRTLRHQPAYTASKSAILGLTRALAASYITEGVRVNGIAPGLVATKMSQTLVSNPDYLSAALRTIPIRRPAAPSELAGAALFLASSLASYVVGHTLIVDGGMMSAP